MRDKDRLAIQCVINGDKERYSELVNRYQKMVYAIAWSHLGDSDLCKDAAQDTFIKAFRYLGALNNPEKFSAWLSRITRNVCSTLLRQRRREVAHYREWKHQQPVATQPAHEPEPRETLEETVQKALAGLPPQQRECLVMFYLEGKSIQEASALLGIRESAMKTRLHRARQALREHLEEKIEQSLAALDPPCNFSASVMILLPAKPLGVVGVGGGFSILGKAVSSVGKMAASLSFILWMTLGQVAFFYLFMSWFSRMESSNIHDKPENQFRKDLLKRNVLIVVIGAFCVMFLSQYVSFQFGTQTLFQLLSIYCCFGVFTSLRQLKVNRSSFMVGQVCTMFLFLFSSIAIGFLAAPVVLVFVVILVMNIMLLFTNQKAPRRMDYNLFLRHARGLLGSLSEEPPVIHEPITQPQFRAFAQFLGEQWLIRDYKIRRQGLLLKLTPVGNTLRSMLSSGFWTPSSLVTIQPNGECTSALHPADAKAINQTQSQPLVPADAQNHLDRALQQAIACFLHGDTGKARSILSSTADKDIFKEEYRKSKSYRLQFAVVIASLIYLVGFGWLTMGLSGFPLQCPDPVTWDMGEQAVRQWVDQSSATLYLDLNALLYSTLVPVEDFLDEASRDKYKTLLWKTIQGPQRRENENELRILRNFENPYGFYHALHNNLLSRSELADIGITEEQVRHVLSQTERIDVQNLFNIEARTSHVQWAGEEVSHTAFDISTYVPRLWLLRYFNGMDIVDTEALARKIAAFQITPSFQLPENFTPVDLAQADGLFHFGYVSYRETYHALWALQILNQMDRVDRSACVEGILRFYRGKGSFRVDNIKKAKIAIYGNDSDAFYAMESLALLNALDQIDDFQAWRFQPITTQRTIKDKTEYGVVTYLQVETLAFQDRLLQRLAGLR
jgi:RNA polymerase sigma factor (sigma-70 family)